MNFYIPKKYATNIMTRFRMSNCKLASTPIPTGTKLSKEDKSLFFNSTLQETGRKSYVSNNNKARHHVRSQPYF